MSAGIEDDAHGELAELVAKRAAASGRTVAVAESLTSGLIASRLGAATDASEWFRGGITAYSSQVKFSLLGVASGPVVCASCAEQMARSAARLLGADVAVATTGVGGPGPQEGQPAGTVFIAVAGAGFADAVHHRFDGDPHEVVDQTTTEALRALAAALDG